MGRYILAAIDDMFFASKVRGAAEHKGLEVRFVKSAEAALEAARADTPALVVADLQSQRCDPLTLAAQFKGEDSLKQVPLIGFLSHVETSLKQGAEDAGFDRVMPRSLFSQRLPEILDGKF